MDEVGMTTPAGSRLGSRTQAFVRTCLIGCLAARLFALGETLAIFSDFSYQNVFVVVALVGVRGVCLQKTFCEEL